MELWKNVKTRIIILEKYKQPLKLHFKAEASSPKPSLPLKPS